MNIEEIRNYFLSKPGTTESFPFDEKTLVFKVMGKMYGLTGLEHAPARVNLKCTPDLCIELRAQYPCVLPGYHMSKTHWNTVVVDGSVPNSIVLEWIDLSYKLVVNGLTKKLKEELKQLEQNEN